MATARDKLIADWQARLIDAQATDASPRTRAGWLARMQVRLYRFLLSLYGDGVWTANSSSARPPANASESASDTVVFDAPDVLPLAGKPPKSIGKIQAVLKSVSAAQDYAPQAGPLAQGLTADCWVTVALVAQKKWPKIAASEAALRRHGIENRLQLLGRRYSLEVRAGDRQQAAQVLAAQPRPATAAKQDPRVIFIRLRPSPLAVPALVIATVVGPSTGLLFVWWLSVWLPGRMAGVDAATARVLLTVALVYVAGFVASVILAMVPVAEAAPESIFRLRIRRRRFANRNLTLRQFTREVLWHCFASGVIIGPLGGLVGLLYASRIAPLEQAAYFLVGWWVAVASVVLLYLCRSARWVFPWLQ